MSSTNPPADQKEKYPYCYKYPHPAMTADCVIFGFDGQQLRLLLVERGCEPFKGCWALPGGFMKIDETIEHTARRELSEETGLNNVYLTQFRVYSRPDRDPRERVVTVAFIALVRPADYHVAGGDDAAQAIWFDETMLPPLAFDHADIIRDAREHLKEILRLRPVAFELLNKVFTISELQTVYEVINRASYDRRNFMRTAIESKVITEVEGRRARTGGRMAKLFTRTVSEIKLEVQHTSGSFFSILSSNKSTSSTCLKEECLKKELSRELSNEKKIEEELKEQPKDSTKGLFNF
ncbi:MAG: NUDIX hydrolase [Muribaculaceae bacterium]|nr:NUDIX hydrolase [Muribaculaceae bacterium]